MLKKLTIISLMFFTAAVALPAAASAQGAACGVYCEEVPDAGGPDGHGGGSNDPGSTGGTDGGSQTSGGDSSSTGTTPLPESTQSGFAGSGADGRAAAKLAREGSPDADALRSAVLEVEAAGAGADNNQPGASPALLGLAGGSAETDGDGLGVGLPIALGVALLAAFAFLIARRRKGSSLS